MSFTKFKATNVNVFLYVLNFFYVMDNQLDYESYILFRNFNMKLAQKDYRLRFIIMAKYKGLSHVVSEATTFIHVPCNKRIPEFKN